MSVIIARTGFDVCPRFRLPCWIVVATFLILLLHGSPQLAHAEGKAIGLQPIAVKTKTQTGVKAGPFSRQCDFYNSPRAFVRSSSLYCTARARNRRTCERRAAQFFSDCRYEGNFERLTQEAKTSMLLMFVFAQAGGKQVQ